jgi:hypothetical protein
MRIEEQTHDLGVQHVTFVFDEKPRSAITLKPHLEPSLHWGGASLLRQEIDASLVNPDHGPIMASVPRSELPEIKARIEEDLAAMDAGDEKIYDPLLDQAKEIRDHLVYARDLIETEMARESV